MRIISQDTTWDLQYEQVMVKQIDNTISFFSYSPDSTEHALTSAYYSTREKASIVMEQMQNAFFSHNMFKAMTAQQKRELFKCEISPQEMYHLYGIFYLPTESEI